ncbi:RNA polymerase sigma factor [Paenibacillus sp. N1-5-1-14]|uniref:RNA polymerase sigma factor n=1 Tax=Paenibacillus radicibacter TaxID=2972488 RepID=UPI0021596DAB|nr:RNA polymerase sigma factor [Paenibacillus radicibacter]MCR8644222.1 RNA polymerase sigma factor [Paenibacillus radicibacter]
MKLARQVKKAKKGDKEALLQLIMAEKDAYYRLAYSYMKNEADAMDALEDMIVKLYEKIEQLKKVESFYSWSKTILVNQCIQMLKKNNKVITLGDGLHEASEQVGQTGTADYRQVEDQMDLEDLMIHLNDEQREAIILKYYRDLDYGTIADMTNTSIGTVKSRIFNGIKKMRQIHGRNDNELH